MSSFHGSLSGRLGEDARGQYTSAGKLVVNFSVAYDVGFGENKKTEWVRVVLFGERWEKIVPLLAKGAAVVVHGDVSLNSYENKDGDTKTSLQLIGQQVDVVAFAKDQERRPVSSGNRKTNSNWDLD